MEFNYVQFFGHSTKFTVDGGQKREQNVKLFRHGRLVKLLFCDVCDRYVQNVSFFRGALAVTQIFVETIRAVVAEYFRQL